MPKNLDLYNKTVNILFNAYFNDTLEHANCFACAVGNIVAANCGYSFIREKPSIYYKHLQWAEVKYDIVEAFEKSWVSVFCTTEEEIEDEETESFEMVKQQEINLNRYTGEPKRQIDSTGYTVEELAKIEYAFETAEEGVSRDEYMFNGLVSVLDVLKKIHEIDDNTEQISRFTREYHSKLA